jgi:hypothetical protein
VVPVYSVFQARVDLPTSYVPSHRRRSNLAGPIDYPIYWIGKSLIIVLLGVFHHWVYSAV